MHDDGLKQLWQEQSFTSLPALPDTKELEAMKRKLKSMDNTIRWGDFRVLAACILGAFFFGIVYLLGENSPLEELGCIVLVFSCVFIGWRILSSRFRLPKAEPNAPVFETIEVELFKVNEQIRLLKSAPGLHILPVCIGFSLVGLGMPSSVSETITALAQVFICSGAIFWLNRFTVKNRLQPLKAELESLLDPSGIVSLSEPKSRRKYYMLKIMIIAIAVALCWAVDLLGATSSEPFAMELSSIEMERQKTK